MKPLPLKRDKKSDRELLVLLGLVELYLQQGKPIGSNTLRDKGFQHLSSATIRNYFAHLEQGGYLRQQHTSGGREPTALAYRYYVDRHHESAKVTDEDRKRLSSLTHDTKEVSTYLQQGAELIAELTGCATFLSAPRFDHDFVLEIKVLPLDASRCLCVLMTDFGSILTEIMPSPKKIDDETARKMEAYFVWRLTGQDRPTLSQEWLDLSGQFYNELMVRYITRYSSFTQDDLIRTGFSKLLSYPEFNNATALASGLALFESPQKMNAILRECERQSALSHWIGEALSPYSQSASHCSVVAIPYFINGHPIGAIGILGPMRMPYRRIIGILRLFSQTVGDHLSRTLYKYKIQYRQPESGALYLKEQETRLIESTPKELKYDQER